MINNIHIDHVGNRKFKFSIVLTNGQEHTGEIENAEVSFGPMLLKDLGPKRLFELRGTLVKDIAIGLIELETKIP